VTDDPSPVPDVRRILDERFALEQQRWPRIQRRQKTLRRLGTVIAALLVIAAVVDVVHPTGSPVHLLPERQFVLPPTTLGCSGVHLLPDGASVVPITVRRAGSEAAMVVEVCLEGQGPFPFLIDTGASSTVIDLKVAARLRLPKAGSPQRYFGIGCSLTTQQERLTTWSVAGLPLASQTVAVQAVPGLGGKGDVDGLLGADTLSRFGAVRFDFAAQTMTFPGPQSPLPRTRSQVRGPLPAPIPAALLSGPPPALAGLTVAEGPTYTVAAAAIHFRGANGGVFLGLDTGSSRSVVDPSLRSVVRLASTNLAEREHTVCSSITMPIVQSGPWSIGKLRLVPLMIGSTSLGQLANSGLLGLLGLDELSRYRYIVIDFTDATLAFGPPTR